MLYSFKDYGDTFGSWWIFGICDGYLLRRVTSFLILLYFWVLLDRNIFIYLFFYVIVRFDEDWLLINRCIDCRGVWLW